MELLHSTEPAALEFTIKLSRSEAKYLDKLFRNLSTEQANNIACIDDDTNIAYHAFRLFEQIAAKF